MDVKTIYATGGAVGESRDPAGDGRRLRRRRLSVRRRQLGVPRRRTARVSWASRGDRRTVSWDDVVHGLAEPVTSTLVRPIPSHHATYLEMIERYAAHERNALGRPSA